MADDVKQVDGGGSKVKYANRVDDAAQRWPTCPECGNQVANTQYAMPGTGKSGAPILNNMCDCSECGNRWTVSTVRDEK